MATPEATATSEPTPVPEAAMMEEQKVLASLANIDTNAVADEVMGSQALTGCLTDLIGMPALMGLTTSEPSQSDLEVIVPCFGDGTVESFAA